ncbi:MAG: hypothetical protein AAGA96_01780 [Verrucomicrobiota bacterium]
MTTLRLTRYTFFVLALSLPSFSRSQNNDRKDFIEGLFRTIIESRIERDRDTIPPGLQPPAISPVTVSNQPVSQELNTYRNQIAAYAQESNALANHLGQISVQNPSLRSYLPELYAVRSQAGLLQQQSPSVQNLTLVQQEFRTLDTTWRTLAHRMRSDRQLDNQCRAAIKKIDGYGNNLCGLFGIQADFDRTQATVYAAQASAYLDWLLDVIQHELYNQPNCDLLLQEGRQQVEVAKQFAENVNRYTMDEAVGAFEQWSASWQQFGAKLHAFQNPDLARAVGRVGRSHNDLYDLMRINRPVDFGYIHYLTGQCGFAVDDLFGNLNISTLSALPRNQLEAVFQAEKTLSAQFDQFSQSVRGTPNQNQVVQNFRALERDWNSCSSILATLPGDVASFRATIDGHITEIRSLLQIAERLDRARTLSQAASVQGMAQSLFNQLVASAGFIPTRSARSQSLVLTQEFLKQSQSFHQQVAAGQDFATLQKSCGMLLDSWQKCSQSIQSLPSYGLNYRVYGPIELARGQIDPSIAELGVVLAP